MINFFYIPPGTTLRFALVILFGALLILHAVLVFWLKLGKRAWKVVDYVWLAFAGLALVGTASQARRLVAQGAVRVIKDAEGTMYDPLRSMVEHTNVVCVKFQRDAYSPPHEEFDRTQREYDMACQWFKEIAPKVPAGHPIDFIDLRTFPPEPMITGKDLQAQLREFHQVVNERNQRAQQLATMETAAETSDPEKTVTLLSPILTALALALRITKVTGELRLD